MELNIVDVNGNMFCIIPNVNKMNQNIRTQIFDYFKVDGIIIEHKIGKPIFYEPVGWEIPCCGNGAIAYYSIRHKINQDVKIINNYHFIAFDVVPHDESKIGNSPIIHISVNNEPHVVFEYSNLLTRPDLVQEYRSNTYNTINPNPYNRDINTTVFFDAGDKFIQTQTFESGVYKQTPSCGTGAIACVYICNKRRIIFNKPLYSHFIIKQNGGIAHVEIIDKKYYYHAPAKLIKSINCKIIKNKLHIQDD